MRLRNGFSLSVSQEFGSSVLGDVSGTLFGADWRIGAKVTTAISVYLQSHLSLGNAKEGANEGLTGNFASAVMGEYALPQRIFFAGGGGFGVLNNPSGPLVQGRIGYYPMSQNSMQGAVRRLNIAFDARVYIASQNGAKYGNITQLALTVGYDRF